MSAPTKGWIDIEGDPRAQPRVKATCRGGIARIYTPNTADQWKSDVGQAVLKAHEGKCVPGPITIEMIFKMRRPAADFGTGKNSAKLKDSAPPFHGKKPDIDNLVKAALDGLVDAGVIEDDKLVVSVLASKCWASSGPSLKPGLSIRITSLIPEAIYLGK